MRLSSHTACHRLVFYSNRLVPISPHSITDASSIMAPLRGQLSLLIILRQTTKRLSVSVGHIILICTYILRFLLWSVCHPSPLMWCKDFRNGEVYSSSTEDLSFQIIDYNESYTQRFVGIPTYSWSIHSNHICFIDPQDIVNHAIGLG